MKPLSSITYISCDSFHFRSLSFSCSFSVCSVRPCVFPVFQIMSPWLDRLSCFFFLCYLLFSWIFLVAFLSPALFVAFQPAYPVSVCLNFWSLFDNSSHVQVLVILSEMFAELICNRQRQKPHQSGFNREMTIKIHWNR